MGFANYRGPLGSCQYAVPVTRRLTICSAWAGIGSEGIQFRPECYQQIIKGGQCPDALLHLFYLPELVTRFACTCLDMFESCRS